MGGPSDAPPAATAANTAPPIEETTSTTPEKTSTTLSVVAKDMLARCPLMEDERGRGECYTIAASVQKDPSICDNLKADAREACYMQVAMASKNAILCVEVSDGKMRETCEAAVAALSGDLAGCGRILDPMLKDECYAGVATKSMNKTLCDNAENASIRLQCSTVIGRLEGMRAAA